jgi:hypothetical protein
MARADRGSPMYTDPKSQSISRLVPFKCYEYLLPKGKFDPPRIAYYFDHDMAGIVGEPHYSSVFAAVDNWRARYLSARRPYMTYRKGWSMIVIEDGRQPQKRAHQYTDGPAKLYEYCADARTRKDIASNFGDEPWIQTALDEFVSKDLMLFLDGRFLSLALPANANFNLESRASSPEQSSTEGMHGNAPAHVA